MRLNRFWATAATAIVLAGCRDRCSQKTPPDCHGRACSQAECLATCAGCCEDGRCVPPSAQSDCVCGGPGTICAGCADGATCSQGWCETPDDICAFSLALRTTTPDNATLAVRERIAGSDGTSSACGGDENSKVLVIGATKITRKLGDVDFDLIIPQRAIPLTMTVGEFRSAGGALGVVRGFTMNNGAHNVTTWRLSEGSAGTISVNRADAPARTADRNPQRAARISKTRVTVCFQGTLERVRGPNEEPRSPDAGVPPEDILELRMIGFDFPLGEFK